MRIQINRQKNQALLSPNECCVLLVDFNPTEPPDLLNAHASYLSHAEVLKKAHALSIPCFTSFKTAGRHRPPCTIALSDTPDDVIFQRSVINPLNDPKLRQEIDAAGRSCLIFISGWPDGSLVQGAITALAEGYDVYVPFDLCTGFSAKTIWSISVRLVQAGVVPLTAQQLILEWTDAADLS